MGIFKNLFNEDARRLKKIEAAIKPIIDLAPAISLLSDEELKAKTNEFKNRLSNGETVDDILPEAFAVAREAARRVLGEFPYPVQLMGGYVLHHGDIAEMKTGEGKTLTAIMPVYLNALTGDGVHVVTVNEYLAERDSEWMGAIYRFLGLTVGLNKHEMTPEEKKAAYACDITYTTNSELGFDYLRDNMVTDIRNRVLRGLNFALIDEVDSILIDEARTPLIISGGEKQTSVLYTEPNKFVKHLTSDDYEIDIKYRNININENGIAKAEKYFGITNLYDIDHTDLVHRINQALKANYVMKKDTDYVVEDNEVIIVDPNTGRKMPGREWSDGLHQAIQAKENVPIKKEMITRATITYQNFFRLYNKLAGMTGTAKTEEEEFLEIYNMRVVVIPTNRPVIREDCPDVIFANKNAKFNALVDEIERVHQTGQPILVGTIAVETSEHISKLLNKRKIKHEVLNAKNHAREAEIIAKAGQLGAVTIATNMAGRGTDIKLGEGVRELGGLYVLGSERHESRRIDNQLRGRSGRQGDPGKSRFYISLEDDLMRRFGSERIQSTFETLGSSAIENKVLSKGIESAQKRVEGMNYDMRKTLLEYDNVLAKQRESMYSQRDYILENEDIHNVTKDMFVRAITNVVDRHTDTHSRHPEIDVDGVIDELNQYIPNDLYARTLYNRDRDEVIYGCLDQIWEEYENKISKYRDQIIPMEKTFTLKIMDRAWTSHIDTMAKLREGIHLRSYGQDNPLQSYMEEGYELYNTMMTTIAFDVFTFCNNFKIQVRQPENTKRRR